MPLLEVTGNLWDVVDRYGGFCIPTNGVVKTNGCDVMGKGFALEALTRHAQIGGFAFMPCTSRFDLALATFARR